MPDERSQQRHPIDPVFKQVLIEELTPLTPALQTEVEVSRLPRTIDALVTLTTDDELQQVCTQTPFFYFLRQNQVEFKGREDALTIAGYHLIGGRTQLYLGEQDVSPQAMTVTIICASKPRAVLAYVRNFQPFHAIEAGYYKNEAHPPVYLIVINELPILPKNYSLLLFASSERKFRQFLEKVIAEGNTRYIRYAYEVRPQVTKEVLTMAGISTTLSREDLKFMAEDIGRELMAFLSPEDRLAGMNVEDRLAGISLEELLEAINSGILLHEISPAHRKVLLELLLSMQTASLKDQKKRNGNGSPN